MIDPKKVEFTVYRSIPHLLVPVVSNPRKAAGALSWAVAEMDKRYALFAEKGVRNLAGYNTYALSENLPKMPQIVIIIDELSDLMMAASNEVEDSICRLAQKARAAGMHLIVATQRPSVDVITGLIKANIPSRIAFAVKSQIDSRTIIDTQGAEKLLGNGDMLFSQNANIERIQCGYIGPEEIKSMTDAIGGQKGAQKCYSTPYYLPEVKDEESSDDGAAVDMKNVDPKFEEAARLVVSTGRASTSYLQTQMGMGFARSARVMSQLEAAGIVGPQNSSKTREVLVENFSELDEIISKYLK
jgi:S-DNA-T family DNA segregation ATPase FtsK/SpoIIIE